MPIAAIPFKSPAPYDLPELFLKPFQDASREGAVEAAFALMSQVDTAEFYASVFVEAGHLVPGPFRSARPDTEAALEAAAAELAGRPLLLEGPEGREHYMARAVHAGSPVLMMGELVADENSPFPDGLHRHLLAGQERGQLGFCYAFPLVDEAGHVHGAIGLRRSLAEGPMNHDQPAIAHAAVLAAGRRLGAILHGQG